jgi:hypothetical protein
MEYVVMAVVGFIMLLLGLNKAQKQKIDALTTASEADKNTIQAMPLEQQVAKDAQTLIGDKDAYDKAMAEYRPGNGSGKPDSGH